MNRTAGWAFPRHLAGASSAGFNICRFARVFGHLHANTDETRPPARPRRQPDHLPSPLSGWASRRSRCWTWSSSIRSTPARLAFQVQTIKDHLTHLPSPRPTNGMLEPQLRKVLAMSCEVETEEAAEITEDKIESFEVELMALSGAVADRYFLQGAAATPTVQVGEPGMIYEIRHRTTYNYVIPGDLRPLRPASDAAVEREPDRDPKWRHHFADTGAARSAGSGRSTRTP